MKKLGWLLFYLALGSLLVQNSFSYLDPDYGWHLAFGREVALTRAVPHDQIYLWTITGQTWVDHEWLSNLVTFLVSSAVGYIGLTIFFALLIVGAVYLINRYVFRHYLREPAQRIGFALVESVALFGMLPHLGIRMQEWTIVLLALMLIVIDSIRRDRRWQRAFWLVLLMYAWACLHGGFLIGVAILIGWAGYEWLRFALGSRAAWLQDEPLPLRILLRLSGILLLALAATAVTPYGLELYSFLSDYRQPFYLTHIQEWRAPYTIPIRYWQIGYGLVVLAAAIGVRFFSRLRLSGWNIAVFVLFAALASKSVRHFPLLATASFIYILPVASRAALSELRSTLSPMIRRLFLFCLALAALASLASARITNEPLNSYCSDYPCGAAAYLKLRPELASKRLFNNYNWGGYLIEAWGEPRLFIDGRLPQYDFKGRTMLEEYVDFFDSAKIETKLDEYEIGLVLIQKNPTAPKLDWFERYVLGYEPNHFKPNTALNDYLKDHENWQPVHEDDVSILYAKQ